MSNSVDTSGFVGRDLNHRWRVGRQLGAGSFGVVHEGVEHGSGLRVAIKFLRPQFLHQSEAVGRFWNEAEALRRLDHPNILVLLDAGASDEGVPYLVTELLQGETLRELLDREGPLPPERALRLLGPAAHGLHHAHRLGIVHRDLKPENVFRVRRDGLGTTKVLDFGMAKLLDTQTARKLSQTGILIGTMAYSPPEQMQGQPDIDGRADQFGFAALIFEALTGRRPFPQTQPFALFQAVLSGDRPRASQVRPGLPAAADAVLARALDPDRDHRYPNLEAFYLALSDALSGSAPQGLGVATRSVPTPAPMNLRWSSQSLEAAVARTSGYPSASPSPAAPRAIEPPESPAPHGPDRPPPVTPVTMQSPNRPARPNAERRPAPPMVNQQDTLPTGQPIAVPPRSRGRPGLWWLVGLAVMLVALVIVALTLAMVRYRSRGLEPRPVASGPTA